MLALTGLCICAKFFCSRRREIDPKLLIEHNDSEKSTQNLTKNFKNSTQNVPEKFDSEKNFKHFDSRNSIQNQKLQNIEPKSVRKNFEAKKPTQNLNQNSLGSLKTSHNRTVYKCDTKLFTIAEHE